MIKQRISFLLGPGGLKAASFFIIKVLVGIDVFRIICKALDLTEMPVIPKIWRYVVLRSAEDLATLHACTAGQLSEQAGSVTGLFKRSGILHALVCDNKVVAQLNIETGSEFEIDDPKLGLTLRKGDAFLGYLYTWPEFRRQGAAQILVAACECYMTGQGFAHLISHVRATNVPSLAVFKQLNWTFSAWAIARPSGATLSVLGLKRMGIEARPRN